MYTMWRENKRKNLCQNLQVEKGDETNNEPGQMAAVESALKLKLQWNQFQ